MCLTLARSSLNEPEKSIKNETYKIIVANSKDN